MKILPNSRIPRVGFMFKHVYAGTVYKIIREGIKGFSNRDVWIYDEMETKFDFKDNLFQALRDGIIEPITKQEYENSSKH